MHDLAILYTQQYKYLPAEPLFKSCLEMRRNLFGDVHKDVLASIKALADLYYLKKDYEMAEPLYIICVEAFQRNWGQKNPETVINVFNFISSIYSIIRKTKNYKFC